MKHRARWPQRPYDVVKVGDTWFRTAPNSTRKGESQPCDKTAYAMALGYSDEVGGEGEPDHWWPVFIHHARGRRLVTLSRLIERLGL